MDECELYGCPREAHPDLELSFYDSTAGEEYPDDVRPRPVCRPHYILRTKVEDNLGHTMFLGMFAALFYLWFYAPEPSGIGGSVIWIGMVVMSGLATMALVAAFLFGIEWAFIRRNASHFTP